jgi:hypothetical protein
MAATPRPWYRSPALWFALPGLVFLVSAWVFSMQRIAYLDLEIGGYSVELENDGSLVGVSWQTTPSPGLLTFPSPKTLAFNVRSRWPWASKDWFPLPSYLVNEPMSPTPRHNVEIPHWFLLLVYAGLWQLPWLARYHRRRRIDRSLAIAPAQPMKAVDGASLD